MTGPTAEQQQAYEEAGRELPPGYYVVVAIVVVSILATLHIVLGPWGFAAGATL